jgi:hypothetical protein
LFILALVSPLLVPLVLVTDPPRDVTVSIVGLLLFGLPMALSLAVVALIGKPAFLFLRSRVAKRGTPPSPVGVIRYRIGLALLTIPVITSWPVPLVSLHVPEIGTHRAFIGAVADGVLLLSLFVLGGEFWAKVHALFVHSARVAPEISGAGGVAGNPELVQMGWRFYLGTAVFVGAAAGWLLVPLASALGKSGSQIASLSGVLFIANKPALVIAIAILGKPGFNRLKCLLFGMLRKLGPPQQVGRRRYDLGLILIMVPMLMTWVEPYAAILGPQSVYWFLQDLPLELLLLIGLFLVGGEFWNKVRALSRACGEDRDRCRSASGARLTSPSSKYSCEDLPGYRQLGRLLETEFEKSFAWHGNLFALLSRCYSGSCACSRERSNPGSFTSTSQAANQRA